MTKNSILPLTNMEFNGSKEAIKLLELSNSDSDSGSDVRFAVIPPVPVQVQTRRKVRTKRRSRNSTSSSSRSPNPHLNHCSWLHLVKFASIAFGLAGFMVLTWFVLTLHSEVQRLTEQLQTVSAETQETPEALQQYKIVLKEIQQNQTLAWNHIGNLSDSLFLIQRQLMSVQTQLKTVQETLKGTPELVNLPKDFDNMKINIAGFGSQLADVQTTLTDIKVKVVELETNRKDDKETLETFKGDVERLNTLIEPPAKEGEQDPVVGLLKDISSLKDNVSLINNTLSSQVKWALDDLHEHHKSISRLEEGALNISSRVSTLEGQCDSFAKQSLVFSSNVSAINASVSSQKEKLLEANQTIKALNTTVELLKTQVANSSSSLKSIWETLRSTVTPAGS